MREFWIDIERDDPLESNTMVYFNEHDGNTEFIKTIHVREISPTEPDWRKLCEELESALEFYASPWGIHQGSPITEVNKFCRDRLNESCTTAQEALAKYRAAIEGEK